MLKYTGSEANMNLGIKRLIKIIVIILICVGVFLAAFFTARYLYSPFYVQGSSMEPTLVQNDVGIKSKVVFSLQRFDVVVINDGDSNIIKRIVGLPGETVAYKDNHLYVNGVLEEETFIDEDARNATCKSTNRFCTTGVTLGADEYFVLGDNRAVSLDSRYLADRQFNKNDILGRAMFVYATSSDGKTLQYRFPLFLAKRVL